MTLNNKFDLTNKTALITGAAGLLGIEHCFSLLEANASIVLTDVSKNRLELAQTSLKKNFPNNDITFYEMDVSDIDSVRKVCDSLAKKNCNIDILINNAAIDPKIGASLTDLEPSRLENFSREQWDTEISVGLTGAFLCSQVFGSKMASKKGGVILNIASDLSIISPDQRLYSKPNLEKDEQPVKPVTYSVIKAGLVGLTKYISTYWAENGVRCNSLSPGGVFNGQDPDFVKKLENLIPMGRMASREEYRATIQYLCSDASSYMTGQNIVIDGGRSVL